MRVIVRKRIYRMLFISLLGLAGCDGALISPQANSFINETPVTSRPIGVVLGLSLETDKPQTKTLSGTLQWQASDDLLVSEYAIYLASDLNTPAQQPLAIVSGVEKENYKFSGNTQVDGYKYILLYTRNVQGQAVQAAAVAI